MQSAHEWLKNPQRSYNDGILILKSKQPKEAAFFEKVKNPPAGSYHFRMLFSKLENIARKELQNPAAKTESAVKTVVRVNDIKKSTSKPAKPGQPLQPGNTGSVRITSNPTVDYKELPEDLQQKFMRNKEITKAMAQKQQELKAAKDDQERKLLMGGLMSLETEKKANWKAIDEWWQNNKPIKKELTAEEKIAQEAILKARRVETLKINIARDKKKLDKLPEEKKSKVIEKITNWEKELSDLQK